MTDRPATITLSEEATQRLYDCIDTRQAAAARINAEPVADDYDEQDEFDIWDHTQEDMGTIVENDIATQLGLELAHP